MNDYCHRNLLSAAVIVFYCTVSFTILHKMYSKQIMASACLFTQIRNIVWDIFVVFFIDKNCTNL